MRDLDLDAVARGAAHAPADLAIVQPHAFADAHTRQGLGQRARHDRGLAAAAGGVARRCLALERPCGQEQ